ncbi:MAG TPA: hypothetical protein VG323_07475 [Thermoanaerobaculia bacterium]|nr:hypothetical protein [Thermoanaerobaculia bacterium]
MRRSLSVFLFLAASTASTASAQIVSLGSAAGISAGTYLGTATIDMSHPANAAGQVTTAFVRGTSNGSCPGSIKLKVVRLDLGNGVFNVVADRGPFTIVPGSNRLTLSPPIDVQAGDYIATVVQPTSCVAVTAGHHRLGDFSLVTAGDFASGRAISSFVMNREVRPIAQLTSTDTLLAGVIPAVGATQGGFGSFFRTSVQFANPTSSASSIRVVFHPIFAAAQANDPSRTFLVAPFTTQTHPDLITEMGLTGIGSMDVITTDGTPPAVTTRVFNDNGDAGTNGFYEDLVAPFDAMHSAESSSFTLPGDLDHFRVNAGVRTLSSTTLTISYYEPNGGTPIGATLFKTYAANYFEQVPLSAFLNDQQLIAGGLLVIRVVTGDAVVYFSTTDNRTNDTAATILRSQ